MAKIEEVKRVIELVSEGYSVLKACKEVGVSNYCFYLYIKESDDLNNDYTRAREERADKIFEEILDIADNAANDLISTDRGSIPNSAAVNRSRLQIDARKWMLGRMMPKKYGGDKHEEETQTDNDLNITIEEI